MQGGTPERRKREISVRQTLHISDPKLTLCLYCVVKMRVGLRPFLELTNIPVLFSIYNHRFVSENELYGPQ